MPQYVMQRSLPKRAAAAGQDSACPAKGESRAEVWPVANDDHCETGADVLWVKTYVTERTMYCLYHAPSEEVLRAHTEKHGFPALRIERVWAVSSTNGGRSA